MQIIKLPHFGIVDADSLDEYSQAFMDYGGTEVSIDLNFENISIETKKLEIVKHFIENIRIHDLKNRKYIEDDFQDSHQETVRFYINKHLEDLALADIEDLIGKNKRTVDQAPLLVKKLHLARVGIYPDNQGAFAIFDYTLGKSLTDYLIVIDTDENGNILSIGMES